MGDLPGFIRDRLEKILPDPTYPTETSWPTAWDTSGSSCLAVSNPETRGTLNRPPDAGRRLLPRDLEYRNSVEAEVRKDVGATRWVPPFWFGGTAWKPVTPSLTPTPSLPCPLAANIPLCRGLLDGGQSPGVIAHRPGEGPVLLELHRVSLTAFEHLAGDFVHLVIQKVGIDAGS